MVGIWADEEADDAGFAFHNGANYFIAVLWLVVLEKGKIDTAEGVVLCCDGLRSYVGKERR